MDKEDPREALIEKARNGSEAAFEELLLLTGGHLKKFIVRRIGSHLRLDPDDVLQETFLRAFKSSGRFEWQGEGSFSRWLQTIADHLITDIARRAGNYSEVRLSIDVPGTGTSPSTHQKREERFDRLKASLQSLSPDHRQVLLLVRIEGLKIRDVAKRMDRSESAVKNLLLRAMKELRSSFGNTESLHLPAKSLLEEGEGEDEK